MKLNSFTALGFTAGLAGGCLATHNAMAAINRWDGASGLRSDQMIDRWKLRIDAGFSRAVPLMNIVPSYHAGRGELAAVPPLRCKITDFRGTAQSRTLKATFPAGRHAWVEWTADLSAPAWTPLTNTVLVPDPTSGVLFASAAWTLSPFPGDRVFCRVASGLNPPAP
jgi:hypothetical protein